jgi:predicted nucleic acid-binding protein
LKAVLDTNIVLDVLLDRHPFSGPAAKIFGWAERSEFSGLLCATTVTTVHYLLSQAFSSRETRQLLSKLLSLFGVAAVNRHVIERALSSSIRDFKDAVLSEAGELAGAECIITRNARDFRKSPLRILDPAEFLAIFHK